MTFEEEFPSLKSKVEHPTDQFGIEIDYINNYQDSDIQKHCLDKQRVKKAIEKTTDIAKKRFGELSEVKFNWYENKLKEELRLK